MSNKDNSDADGNKVSDEVSCDKKGEIGENNLSDASESSEDVDEIEQWLQRLVMGGSSGSKGTCNGWFFWKQGKVRTITRRI